MARTKIKNSSNQEYDSVYFLKILLYLLLGTLWLAFGDRKYVPLGVLVGLLIAQHERLRVDRKIEYALLIIGGLLGLVGIGVTIRL